MGEEGRDGGAPVPRARPMEALFLVSHGVSDVRLVREVGVGLPEAGATIELGLEQGSFGACVGGDEGADTEAPGSRGGEDPLPAALAGGDDGNEIVQGELRVFAECWDC